MKYQIVVRYERENYRSESEVFTDEEFKQLCETLIEVSRGKGLSFNTENGWCVFPSRVLERSIISIERVE